MSRTAASNQPTNNPTSEANRRDTVPLEKDEKDETKRQAPYKPVAHMEQSVASFGGANMKNNRGRSRMSDVMITDALTDVRIKYHINPKEVGHGHYGVVRKCMDRKSKEWFAIKSILKSKVGKVDVLKREIAILKEVKHPNIIKLISVHEDAKYLHLVTELCTGGELFDRIIEKTQSEEGHFSERDAANLVKSILDAIAYCHDVKQIVHRDLKPENFLFQTEAEDAPVKIIDFGLSRYDNQNAGVMKTKVGTPYYVAPEVLNREYTKSCDIWSIGVITYILLCGYPPFYGDSDNEIFSSVRTGLFDFPSPDWDGISESAKDFICCLLKKDPSQRLVWILLFVA
jgi:calcium-dependent protein kinase